MDFWHTTGSVDVLVVFLDKENRPETGNHDVIEVNISGC